MKCARCHREVRNPVDIAGMKLGDACAAAIRRALLQPAPAAEVPQQPDPRQRDFFQATDLLGSPA